MSSGTVVCCRLVDPEMVEQESEQYDCTACPVATQERALDSENREAWHIYRTCANRFLVDASAVGVALDRLTAGYEGEDFAELAARLALLHDVLNPKKAT